MAERVTKETWFRISGLETLDDDSLKWFKFIVDDDELEELEALQPLGSKFKGLFLRERGIGSPQGTPQPIFKKDRQEKMSKLTFNGNFSDRGSPSKSKSQGRADISSQQLKPSESLKNYELEASDSIISEGKNIRPSSWDESDNELSCRDEIISTESGRIYSAETDQNAESVAFELGKIKEQFFRPRKTDVSENSALDSSEFSRALKSPENKVDSKLKLEIDRRQTPARVRRRTRSSSSSSPTHDSINFQEFPGKSELYDDSPHQQNNELDINSNNHLDNMFSELLNRQNDIFNSEWSTLHSNHLALEEDNYDNRKDSETLIKGTASDEDFYYCRTLRKLSQILEVEEGKKDSDGNGREAIESLDENLEEKLSEISVSPKSSQQLDNNTLSSVSTSCSRKPSTHNKNSPHTFFQCQVQDSVLLEKLRNIKRNSKGSISDRTYHRVFKNPDSNDFVILTPKSAKTTIDVNEDGDLEVEKSMQDLTNYSYVDSAWTGNFLKDIKAKENLHLQISTPTSEETSPRRNKDSSHGSDNIKSRNTMKKDLQSHKSSPKSSVSVNNSSPRSLKILDVKTPNSEKGNNNNNNKRGKRRKKIKENLSIETITTNRIGYVKSPKSSEKSQSARKSSEENFSSKLEKSRQNSPNSAKNRSPKSNKNDLYSSSESLKKDSGRSVGSNNSFILMRNKVKENSRWNQNLKSPGSDRISELGLPLSLESPNYQGTNTSDRSENSFRKNKSPESQKSSKTSATVKPKRKEAITKNNSNNSGINSFNSFNLSSAKTSSFNGPKSNRGSEFYDNFQEKEKVEISDRRSPQEKPEKASCKFEIEFAEDQTDKLFHGHRVSPVAQEFQKEKEVKISEDEEKESSRSEEYLFYGDGKSPNQPAHSSLASLCNHNEKTLQKTDEIIDSTRDSNSCSKCSSRSSNRSFTIKAEEEILDREKTAKSKSSSRKSSHRTLSIIDETSHEALLKSAESFEEGIANIQSRRSSGRSSPNKAKSFVDIIEKAGNREEKESGGRKTVRNTSSTYLEDVNKRKRGKSSFEEVMWQDLVERFDAMDENLSVNSSVVNKFPGFPRKKSQSQSSKDSITSSFEIQNEVSKLEIKKKKDLPDSEPRTEEKEKLSKLQIKAANSLPETADKPEKLDKRSPYFPPEYNIKKNQQPKMFYFDVKMMDNQKIGEFGDVTCCSIGKFEITPSGKPNVFGDGDQGGRTGWDQIAANSMLDKPKKDNEKKSQRQLWTEVTPTYEFEKPLLSIQQIKQADLNFKEYFPVNSFKVLSAAVENYQSSRSAKSLTEEIHVKGNTSFIIAPSLNQRLSNSLKHVAPLPENRNEITLKQSTYTSTGDLFEMTFQNSKEEKEFSNFNIFLANKKKCDKNPKPKNWLTIGHGKCDSEKSTFRKSRLKKKKKSCKESVHAIETTTSSGRSKPSIPPLRFKNTNCIQNFYKRLISTFCITSHSSAATSK